jgi:hypothetical protein
MASKISPFSAIPKFSREKRAMIWRENGLNLEPPTKYCHLEDTKGKSYDLGREPAIVTARAVVAERAQFRRRQRPATGSDGLVLPFLHLDSTAAHTRFSSEAIHPDPPP